jgi:hypothetical protein
VSFQRSVSRQRSHEKNYELRLGQSWQNKRAIIPPESDLAEKETLHREAISEFAGPWTSVQRGAPGHWKMWLGVSVR